MILSTSDIGKVTPIPSQSSDPRHQPTPTVKTPPQATPPQPPIAPSSVQSTLLALLNQAANAVATVNGYVFPSVPRLWDRALMPSCQANNTKHSHSSFSSRTPFGCESARVIPAVDTDSQSRWCSPYTARNSTRVISAIVHYCQCSSCSTSCWRSFPASAISR